MQNMGIQYAESSIIEGGQRMAYVKKGKKKTPIILLLLCFLLLGTDAYAACTGSSPTWTATPDYASVSSCVSQATTSDTVNVSAGSQTWTSTLTITKGINLIGAGIGNTVITNSVVNGWIIIYSPSTPTNNDPLRISGFTFNLNSTCNGINLSAVNNTPPTAQTKIRIDHNRFTGSPSSYSYQAIWNNGMRGVIDHNTFDSIIYPIRNAVGPNTGSLWWDNWSLVIFGATDNNMYFEDNVFTGTEIIMDCQYSNRYAFRYNTVTLSTGAYPMLDMHGNQPGGAMWACFGGEVYGNQINAGTYNADMLDQRGGKVVMFNNNFSSSGSAYTQVREEYDDAGSTTTQQPQHPVDSYYWNNRLNLTGSLISTNVAGTATESLESNRVAPQANMDFFTQGASFDGTTGVGCGTLANRPTTCTAGTDAFGHSYGVGYWATNQSCTDLTGMVGTNHKTPISGTLYKCTSTNTWTAYYTPYIYPHPLQGNLAPPINIKGKIDSQP